MYNSKNVWQSFSVITQTQSTFIIIHVLFNTITYNNKYNRYTACMDIIYILYILPTYYILPIYSTYSILYTLYSILYILYSCKPQGRNYCKL